LENISRVGLIYVPEEGKRPVTGHMRFVDHDQVAMADKELLAMNPGLAYTPSPATTPWTYLWDRKVRGLSKIPGMSHGGGLVIIAPNTSGLLKSYFKAEWRGNEHGFRKAGKERITNRHKLREALMADVEKYAALLPVRVSGDDIYSQVIRQGPGRRHIWLMDNRLVNPGRRTARLRIQLPGRWEIRDRITQRVLRSSVTPSESFTVDVPAGLFRVLEMTRTP